jgi:CheY-like chemotaxis protein
MTVQNLAGGDRMISVLLLDPFVDEGEMYSEYLRSQGFDVRLHRVASAGLREVADANPDIVVTRLRQERHEIDGVEITRLLKRDEATRHIPVVMITTSMLASDARAAAEAACDAYLVLPVPPDALAAELRRLSGAHGDPPEE